jgi:hypothetical protein
VPESSRVGLGVTNLQKDSTMFESTIRSRGLGNLNEDRLRAIAKEFTRLYGSNGEIVVGGASRIQREAY